MPCSKSKSNSATIFLYIPRSSFEVLGFDWIHLVVLELKDRMFLPPSISHGEEIGEHLTASSSEALQRI